MSIGTATESFGSGMVGASVESTMHTSCRLVQREATPSPFSGNLASATGRIGSDGCGGGGGEWHRRLEELSDHFCRSRSQAQRSLAQHIQEMERRMLQAREEEQQQLLRFLTEWHDGSEACMASQGTQLAGLERRVCDDIVAEIDCLARDCIRRVDMDAMYDRCQRLEADITLSTGRAIETAIAAALEKAEVTSRAMVAKSAESIDSVRSDVMSGINDISRGLNDVSNIVHSNAQACDVLGVRLEELNVRFEKVERSSTASDQAIEALSPAVDRVRDKLSRVEDQAWAEVTQAEEAQSAVSQRERQHAEAVKSQREELAQLMAVTGQMQTQLATSEQQMDQLLSSRLREAEERLIASHGELCSQVVDVVAKQEIKAGLAKNEAEMQSFTAGISPVSHMESMKKSSMATTPELGPLSPSHETLLSIHTPNASAVKLGGGTDGTGCQEVQTPHTTNGDSWVWQMQKPTRQSRVVSGSPLAWAIPMRTAHSPSNCTSRHQALILQSSGGSTAALGHSHSANAMMSKQAVLASNIDTASQQPARNQLSPKGATPLVVTKHTFTNCDVDATVPSPFERRSVSPPAMCVQARHNRGELNSAKNHAP